jgi:hypothetical protein
MNDEMFSDLKQFILATVSQATVGIATKADMDAGLAKVDKRFAQMDNRFDKVDLRFNKIDKHIDELGLKLTTIADAHSEDLDEHDKRLIKLEPRTA